MVLPLCSRSRSCSSSAPALGRARAPALLSRSLLRELTLCDNNIDKEGAAAIAEAMEANSTLQYLNIRLNDFNVQNNLSLREAGSRRHTYTLTSKP